MVIDLISLFISFLLAYWLKFGNLKLNYGGQVVWIRYLVLVLVVTLMVYLVPQLIDSIKQFMDNMDGYVRSLKDYVKNLRQGGWKAFGMDVRCFLGTIFSVLRSDGVVEGGTGELKKGKDKR